MLFPLFPLFPSSPWPAVELEEIDTAPFRDRYGPNSVQLRPAIGPQAAE